MPTWNTEIAHNSQIKFNGTVLNLSRQVRGKVNESSPLGWENIPFAGDKLVHKAELNEPFSPRAVHTVCSPGQAPVAYVRTRPFKSQKWKQDGTRGSPGRWSCCPETCDLKTWKGVSDFIRGPRDEEIMLHGYKGKEP